MIQNRICEAVVATLSFVGLVLRGVAIPTVLLASLIGQQHGFAQPCGMWAGSISVKDIQCSPTAILVSGQGQFSPCCGGPGCWPTITIKNLTTGFETFVEVGGCGGCDCVYSLTLTATPPAYNVGDVVMFIRGNRELNGTPVLCEATGPTAVVPSNAPLSPPTNVQASDGQFCDGVHVSWTQLNGATTYTVLRNSSNEPVSAATVGVVSAPSTSFNDAGAEPGIAYFYWVKAANDCPQSPSPPSAPDTGQRAPGAVHIDSNPTDKTICVSGTATFSIAASGAAPLSYHWRHNGINLTNGGHFSGVTTATLTISNAGPSDAGSYDCVVSNPCGNATSAAAALIINVGPVINAPPSNTAVCVGATTTLTVQGSSTIPFTYQWRKGIVALANGPTPNGSVIAGATTDTLSIASTSAADSGLYNCVLTNSCQATTSASASLTVNGIPTFTANPSGLAACTGTFATFSVVASGGSVPLSYQWRKGSVNLANGSTPSGSIISGATSSALGIASVTAADGGLYDCVVTSVCGSVASQGAALDIFCQCIPPFSQTGGVNDNFSTANGSEPASPRPALSLAATNYFGYPLIGFDVVPGNGGNSRRVFAHSHTGLPADAISGVLTLHLRAGGSVGPAQPGDDTIRLGFADGAPNGGIPGFWSSTISALLQPPGPWNSGSDATLNLNLAALPIAGGGTTNLLPLINANGFLDVLVEDKTGADYVTIALTRPPSPVYPWFAAQPQNAQACPGANATFLVTGNAAGEPFTYHWRKNGVNLSDVPGQIVGANTPMFTVLGVFAADVGTYDCVVINACDSATSNSATLSVASCCPADIAIDGFVNIDDLLAVINGWGLCANPINCPADIAPSGGNGIVDIDDLLGVINAWGPCP